MSTKITIISTKGGVGKTTLTANFGAALADLGKKVLLIDTDSQQSLSKFFSYSHTAKHGLVSFITRTPLINNEIAPENCISKTNIQGLDIIYNDDRDNQLKDWILGNAVSHMRFLDVALQKIDSLYDVVLIDTKGTSGIGDLQEKAIRASDLLITPFSPNWVSATELTNTLRMLERLNPPLNTPQQIKFPPLSLVVYMMRNTADNKAVVETIQGGELYKDCCKRNSQFSVFNTIFPFYESYNKATRKQIPIHQYETSRDSGLSGAECMLSFIQEIFPEFEGKGFPKNTGVSK